MRRFLSLVFLALTLAPGAGGPAVADEEDQLSGLVMPGDSVDLNEFAWKKRLLIVFADSPADPQYIQQMEYIAQRPDDLAARDVVVLTDTASGEGSALRTKLRPRGFMLVLIGKDGTIYLRKPLPWSVREISRTINKLPVRQREMREGQGDS